jgi:hypothetical protein
MSALGAFQDAFAAALADPERTAGPMQALARQPGFAVYRNTVMKGSIDALQGNFPAVTRLAGEEWLRAAAAVYVRGALPSTPMLARYGEDFPAFLARFEPAQALPYLAGVARCDRLWTEAHLAADEPVLDGAAIASLAPERLAELRLRPHVAARWVWFNDAPVAALWLNTRAALPVDDIDWQPDGILVTRPRDAVLTASLSRAGCAFLDACAAGATLAETVARTLGVDPHTDLQALMAQLVAAGAFAALPMEPST